MRTAPAYPHLDRARFALAAQKVLQACSTQEGNNCDIYAHIVSAALQRMEVPAEIRVGYAAWRTGPGLDDVVLHHPIGTQVATHPGARTFLYHAWVQAGQDILDFTTYQLRDKARVISAADGRPLDVDWCPSYIWAAVHSAVNIHKVVNGHAPGLYCYQPNRVVHDQLKRIHDYAKDVDDYHVDALLQTYALLAQSDINVFGPANLGSNTGNAHE